MLPIPLGQSCSWDPELIEAGAKHYVGYGAAIGGRDYNSAYIPENQLRNVFLPPFHAAVEAGAGTFMSAFNDVNGVPATGNRFTLQTILRDEWGFDGFVVSDWESVTEMIVHGYCADEREAIVNQPELICFLRERPDVCACIDVTEPEPPEADCPSSTCPTWCSPPIWPVPWATNADGSGSLSATKSTAIWQEGRSKGKSPANWPPHWHKATAAILEISPECRPSCSGSGNRRCIADCMSKRDACPTVSGGACRAGAGGRFSGRAGCGVSASGGGARRAGRP